jgi:hypothetical protein
VGYLDENVLYNIVEEKYKIAKGEARAAFSDVLDTICKMPIADVEPMAKWISVEERLPEKAGRYLVYCVIGDMPLICGAHYDKYNGFGDDDFTHWMPLPEPPKGEKHDPA